MKKNIYFYVVGGLILLVLILFIRNCNLKNSISYYEATKSKIILDHKTEIEKINKDHENEMKKLNIALDNTKDTLRNTFEENKIWKEKAVVRANQIKELKISCEEKLELSFQENEKLIFRIADMNDKFKITTDNLISDYEKIIDEKDKIRGKLKQEINEIITDMEKLVEDNVKLKKENKKLKKTLRWSIAGVAISVGGNVYQSKILKNIL